jgi:exosortase
MPQPLPRFADKSGQWVTIVITSMPTGAGTTARISPSVRFALLCLVSLVVGWRPLFNTFALALRVDEYTHLLLIVPISAWLIFSERSLWGPGSEPAAGSGPVLLIIAIVIGGLSRALAPPDMQLSVSMIAIVIWWIGSFVLCFGARTARLFLFPLCFLFWLVPIPAPLLERIIAIWQHGSAISASLLFSALGIPNTQDGITLSIPGLNLEVAQECSSLRSSLMLIVTSMVLANLFLRSFWRKTVVVLAAIPLSIAKNGLRIVTISMLGTRVDPGFLHGNLHRHGGIVFFLLALFAVGALLWFLSRSENSVRPSSLKPVAVQKL